MKKGKPGKNQPQKSKKKPAGAKRIVGAKVLPFEAGKGFGGVPKDKKLVLHLGLGTVNRTQLNARFKAEGWHELRVDADPKTGAHVVSDMFTLNSAPKNIADGVWMPHLLQRFTFAQVPPFLAQVKRILKPGGEVILTVPDMYALARAIIDQGFEKPFDPHKPNTPSPLDLIYGPRSDIMNGKPIYFETGFVAQTLASRLVEAGFGRVRVIREGAVLTAQAFKLEQLTDADKQVRITGDDVNQMMQKRDEIDAPPTKWNNPNI